MTLRDPTVRALRGKATQLLGLGGISVTQVRDDGAGGSVVYVVTAEDGAPGPVPPVGCSPPG
jgi:hypothetical protein